jgi:hypothetical protein
MIDIDKSPKIQQARAEINRLGWKLAEERRAFLFELCAWKECVNEATGEWGKFITLSYVCDAEGPNVEKAYDQVLGDIASDNVAWRLGGVFPDPTAPFYPRNEQKIS